jgi:GTP pyrophosphokinase
MDRDYEKETYTRAQKVFDVMSTRITTEDMRRLKEAFELAKTAHAPQRRKSGEPYIFHPIAVATIAAVELNLDVNSVIAAFLHDVVEDTNYTIDEIQHRFGADVAYLVRTLTKQKKEKYEMSKQLDNFKQILSSVHYDTRAVLIKLADRMHNMRTLDSMRPDKQMKIAGETDYFYAPFANRLGLYSVKIELENLSFRYRCPHEYEHLCSLIRKDREQNAEKVEAFRQDIISTLSDGGVSGINVEVQYREPYSLWRKMRKYGDDYKHLKYRRVVKIIFPDTTREAEKPTVLKIYSMLTDKFQEKPGGISNYIDSPKENGYQSFHVKLLAPYGKWEEVHIGSERMSRDARLLRLTEVQGSSIQRWITKFREALADISKNAGNGNYIESVVTSFYNDDILCYTPKGKPINLPQRATALDFAFEVHSDVGRHAHYARINGWLSSIRTELHRGDVVEIFTDPEINPKPDWMETVVSDKAKRFLRSYIAKLPKPKFKRCAQCNPIPGEEVVGYLEADGSITVHKRDCPTAIRLATQHGDNIRSVEFEADESTLYPVTISVRAVDRFHLFIDLVECITNELRLTMTRFTTNTNDAIVSCEIDFGVHSYHELQSVINHIASIPAVDEVKQK